MRCTISQYEKDPQGCLRRMTDLELERFKGTLDRHIKRLRKREEKLRREEEARSEAMWKSIKDTEHWYQIVEIAVMGIVKECEARQLLLTEQDINRYGRLIGNLIHDMPDVRTGLQSKKSAERCKRSTKEYKTHSCWDHWHPRQWAGVQIIKKALIGELTSDVLAEMLHKYREVVLVLKTENSKDLKPYQGVDTFCGDPKTSYDMAGIKLVPELKRKKVWKR